GSRDVLAPRASVVGIKIASFNPLTPPCCTPRNPRRPPSSTTRVPVVVSAAVKMCCRGFRSNSHLPSLIASADLPSPRGALIATSRYLNRPPSRLNASPATSRCQSNSGSLKRSQNATKSSRTSPSTVTGAVTTPPAVAGASPATAPAPALGTPRSRPPPRSAAGGSPDDVLRACVQGAPSRYALAPPLRPHGPSSPRQQPPGAAAEPPAPARPAGRGRSAPRAPPGTGDRRSRSGRDPSLD